MTQGLNVESLTVKRGALTLCHNIDLSVPPGEITVLLGPNGAGKTTLLDCIAGKLRSASGTIHLNGLRIDELPMHRRSERGLSYIEQGRNFFSRLTVAQNIFVVDRSPAALTQTFELFPRLEKKSNLKASLLSGGEQQMLMIAVALATRPQILLIDELSLGLSASAIAPLTTALTSLAEAGMGILLVEQFVDLALRLGSTAHVMHQGKIVQSGSCESMLKDRDSIIFPDFQ